MKRKIIIGLAIIAISSIIGVFTIGQAKKASTTPENTLTLAYKYLDEGDYEQAILTFKAVIEIEENSIDARIGIADAYIALNQSDQAILYFEEILLINDKNDTAYQKLAQIYINMGQMDKAKGILQKGIEQTGNEKLKNALEKLKNLSTNIVLDESKKEEIEIPSEEIGDISMSIYDGELGFYLPETIKENSKVMLYLNGDKIAETTESYITLPINDERLINSLSTISVAYYEGDNKQPYASKNLNDFLVYDENSADIETIKNAEYFTQVNMTNIEILSNFKNLVYVNLNGRFNNPLNIVGDISVLHGLDSLREINLAATQITGNINALSGLNNLTYIDLDHTQVNGKLGALKDLTNLKLIGLGDSQVTGDISSIGELKNLEGIYLGNLRITGNISVLNELSYLKSINMEGTKVTGNISAFTGLNNLQFLWMYATNIEGDISALSGLKSLSSFSFQGCNQISGDIAALSKMNNLSQFLLDATQVTGDISVLCQLNKLWFVYLGQTTVTGDISVLRMLSNLQELRLNDTQVVGDISTLSELSNLRCLGVDNTKCTGTLTLSNGNVVTTD